MRIYLASPWFNEEQSERENRVKSKLRELGFEVFSPREFKVLDIDASDSDMNVTFSKNIEQILESDMIFAITDGKDMGTIWEAGCAYGFVKSGYKDLKIVYYCETLGNHPFNLMLQKSADYVVTDFEELDNLEELVSDKKASDKRLGVY